MSSLVDEFLNDLDQEELDDMPSIPPPPPAQPSSKFVAPKPVAAAAASSASSASRDDNDEDDEDDEDEDMEEAAAAGTGGSVVLLSDADAFRNVKFENLAKLLRSDDLQNHLKTIDLLIKKRSGGTGSEYDAAQSEYEHIVRSNRFITSIDEEISILHKYLIDLYSQKFPDLESNVYNALDYARVVYRIGNAKDLSLVKDMGDILPQSVVMVIKVTFSTDAALRFLSYEQLYEVSASSAEILALDETKHKLLRYVASRMSDLAPNLSAVVGTTVAAQLIGIAGGLSQLIKIPANHMQALGKYKRNLAGFSAAGSSFAEIRHVGFIASSELMHSTPPEHRRKAGRLIANKAILAARVDGSHSAKDGSHGRKLRAEIEAAIHKWQEPAPARQEKPLAAPDAKKKTKRGGRNARRIKDKTRYTEIRKKYNRIMFGKEESGDEYGTGRGFGLLSYEGAPGSIRGPYIQTRVKPKNGSGSVTGSGGYYGGSSTSTASGSISGLYSSLALASSTGIYLFNPSYSAIGAKRKFSEFYDSAGTASTASASDGSASSSTVVPGTYSYFGSSSFFKKRKT